MQTNPRATSLTVRIIGNDRVNPNRDTALDDLKLIGFAIWERRTGGGHNVTFPARQHSVNGERRSFALLRPVTDTAA